MAHSRTFKALLLASGQLMSSAVGLLSVAVLSRVLITHDYATYRQTLMAYNFAAPLLALGLPKALYYFLPNEEKRPRGVLFENLLLLFLMGGVLSVFLAAGGSRLLAWRFHNADLEATLLWLIPYPLVMLPVLALPATLMARDRPRQVAGYNVVSRLVMLGCVLAGALIWRTPAAALGATVVGAVVLFFPAVGLMTKACPPSPWRPTLAGMRSQLLFSVPLGLATMVGALHLGLDKIVVSSLCSTEEFAVYVNGAVEVPLVGVLAYSASMVLLPELIRLRKEGRGDDAVALWKRTMVKSASVLLPALVFLMVLADDFVVGVFSERYAESALPFRVYLLMLVLRCTPTESIFIAFRRNRIILLRTLGSLVLNLGLTLLLVHLVGYMGAVISTVLVANVWALPATLFLASRVTGTPLRRIYPFGAIGRILLAAGTGALVLLARPLLDPLPRLAAIAVLFVPYTAVALLVMDRLGVKDARQVLEGALRRLRGGAPDAGEAPPRTKEQQP